MINCNLKSVEKVLSNRDLNGIIARYLLLNDIRNIANTCKYLQYLVADESILNFLHPHYYDRVDNIYNFKQKCNAIYNMKNGTLMRDGEKRDEKRR